MPQISGLFLDHFNQLSQEEVDKILAAVKPVLVTLTDDFWGHLDWGMSLLLLLIDLRAVFNMVEYDLLTHHLTNMGISGSALR